MTFIKHFEKKIFSSRISYFINQKCLFLPPLILVTMNVKVFSPADLIESNNDCRNKFIWSNPTFFKITPIIEFLINKYLCDACIRLSRMLNLVKRDERIGNFWQKEWDLLAWSHLKYEYISSNLTLSLNRKTSKQIRIVKRNCIQNIKKTSLKIILKSTNAQRFSAKNA